MTPPPTHPPGATPRRAPRWVVGSLIALGVGGPLLAILVFLAIWQVLQPAERDAGQPVAIDGCESAHLLAPGAGDAARASSGAYRLVCRNEKERPPTCEQVFSRFVHAHGAVPGPVRVIVDYQVHEQCHRLFDEPGGDR
jgi:hypothetical protein